MVFGLGAGEVGVKVATVLEAFIATVPGNIVSVCVRDREGERLFHSECVDCFRIHRLAERRANCGTGYNVLGGIGAGRYVGSSVAWA